MFGISMSRDWRRGQHPEQVGGRTRMDRERLQVEPELMLGPPQRRQPDQEQRDADQHAMEALRICVQLRRSRRRGWGQIDHTAMVGPACSEARAQKIGPRRKPDAGPRV